MHARSRWPKRSAWRGQAHARSPGTGSARPWPSAPSSQTARKLHSMPGNMHECSPPSMCGKKGEPPGHPARTAAAADAASARPRGWQHTPWPRAPAPARGRRASTGKAMRPRCRACKRCTSEPALVHDPALTWQTMHLPRRPPCRHTAWADETVKQRSAELQEHAGSLPRLHAEACQRSALSKNHNLGGEDRADCDESPPDPAAAPAATYSRQVMLFLLRRCWCSCCCHRCRRRRRRRAAAAAAS
jgi:hypothetical protein